MSDKNFRSLARTYRASIERRLRELQVRRKPTYVYDPIRYVLASGGKRLRGFLVLLACEAVGGDAHSAVDAAVAVELLHNFTLIHDDVMDHASVRRGKPTVHKKWNDDVAILSGDELVAHAYRFLLGRPSARTPAIVTAFTDAFIQVCEGQGFDKEFEMRRKVSASDYLMMTGKKTARLFSAAAEIGALVGNGSRDEVLALQSFGHKLGLAFQIKDDLLDIVGDEERFGKSIGGDIIEGKKTYLLVQALSQARGKDLALLRRVAPEGGLGRSAVGKILRLYRKYDVLEGAQRKIAECTRSAERALTTLRRGRATSALRWLAGTLLERTS